MNYLLILVIVILGGFALYGRHRGFIRTVFALFSMIFALLLTSWVSPVVSKELQKNEKAMSFVTNKVAKIVTGDKIGNKKTDQLDYIGKLPLPKTVKNTLIENNTTDIYKAMGVDSFKDYITSAVSRIIINAAVYFAITILIIIGLALLCQILDIISKLPLINGLNKTAGLLVGLLQGLIVIWIGCIFITMISSSKLGQTIFELINQDKFLSLIYNNNLLLRFITNLGATLF